MNKLEGIHFKIIKSEIDSEDGSIYLNNLTEKLTEMTTDIAIKFADYIAENWNPNGRNGCWDSRELNSQREIKYLVDSTKALFEIFINNHYGK
jgi:hypothetical protein